MRRKRKYVACIESASGEKKTLFGDLTRTDLSIKSNNMNKEEAECESDWKMNMG